MEAKIFVTFRIKEGLSFVKGKSTIKYEVFLVVYLRIYLSPLKYRQPVLRTVPN